MVQSLNLFLSTLLIGTTSLCPPVKNSYTICIPQHIDLNGSGQFDVSLVDLEISQNDSISISFDDSFILTDAHGKGTINGYITNGNISFTSDDPNPKTISYSVDNAAAGDWQGTLNVSIKMDSIEETKTSSLIDGPSINSILKELNPTVISFSHNNCGDNYLYDLSSENDGSIVLYMDDTTCVITNKKDEPIKCNTNMSHIFDSLTATQINNLNYLDTSTCEDLSYAFNGMTNCTTINGIESLDVSNVTNFSHLFYGDENLIAVPNIQGWKVSNKCLDISYMLGSICYEAGVNSSSRWPNSFDLSGWDVSNVVDMSYTFENSFMMETLNLTGWNTSKLANMEGMFKMKDNNEKSRLQRIIGIENFNVSNVESMYYSFYECRNLNADNNFSTWTPSSLTELRYAFYNTMYLNLRHFDNWNSYFNVSSKKMKNCFGQNAGYYVEPNYRPSWYS